MSYDVETSETVLHGTRKKGVRRSFAYRSQIIKRARVKGLAYTNWKGKSIAAIPSGVNKDCKCRRKCYTQVSEEDREATFSRFRSFETKNDQDSYLQALISKSTVKQRRRRKAPEESSKPSRGYSYIYEVPTPSGKVVVCKTAFTNIHGISQERVRRLCMLLAAGMTPIDMRGKSASRWPVWPSPNELASSNKKELAQPSGNELASPSGEELSYPIENKLASPSGEELPNPSGKVLVSPSRKELAYPSGKIPIIKKNPYL